MAIKYNPRFYPEDNENPIRTGIENFFKKFEMFRGNTDPEEAEAPPPGLSRDEKIGPNGMMSQSVEKTTQVAPKPMNPSIKQTTRIDPIARGTVSSPSRFKGGGEEGSPVDFLSGMNSFGDDADLSEDNVYSQDLDETETLDADDDAAGMIPSGSYNSPQSDQDQDQDQDQSDPFSMMMDDKESPSISEYREHLGRMPQRQDPGLKNKILAAIAGIGVGIKNPAAGAATTLGLLDRPHEMSLRDWQQKGAGLKDIAGLDVASENRRMQNILRALTYKGTQDYRAGMQRDRAATREDRRRAGESLADYRARTLGIAERNAATAERRAGTAAGRAGLVRRHTTADQERATKMAEAKVLKKFPEFNDFWTTSGGYKVLRPEIKNRTEGAKIKGSGQSMLQAWDNFQRIVEAESKRILKESDPSREPYVSDRDED